MVRRRYDCRGVRGGLPHARVERALLVVRAVGFAALVLVGCGGCARGPPCAFAFGPLFLWGGI